MRWALAALVVCALAGCGLGAGERTVDKEVRLQVTRDFGRTFLESAKTRKIPEGETVMRFMQRRFEVETRYGGGFVQTIEGLPGDSAHKADWFYYVNGVEASDGAAAHRIHPGDQIWWDRHNWSGAMRIPAVVGSFPEPFLSGVDGKRLPVRVDCAPQSGRVCDEVSKRLQAAGVKAAAQAAIGQGAGAQVLRVVVGPWSEVRRDPTASILEKGPAASGVFARPHGDAIDLLDQNGKVAHTLTDAGGLVAATRFEDQQPTWFVTGTDDAGVDAAASAFEEGVLKNRFAVAVENGLSEPLPVSNLP
jgi:uncharacterized protein DUF4430